MNQKLIDTALGGEMKLKCSWPIGHFPTVGEKIEIKGKLLTITKIGTVTVKDGNFIAEVELSESKVN